jgi:hypothetical protein
MSPATPTIEKAPIAYPERQITTLAKAFVTRSLPNS